MSVLIPFAPLVKVGPEIEKNASKRRGLGANDGLVSDRLCSNWINTFRGAKGDIGLFFIVAFRSAKGRV
jgi:hypothetical protein